MEMWVYADKGILYWHIQYLPIYSSIHISLPYIFFSLSTLLSLPSLFQSLSTLFHNILSPLAPTFGIFTQPNDRVSQCHATNKQRNYAVEVEENVITGLCKYIGSLLCSKATIHCNYFHMSERM